MIDGFDIILMLLTVITIYTILKLVFVQATGCYCELELENIVTEDEATVGVYEGKRGEISLTVTHTYLSGEIPVMIGVTADRLGNTYTDKQYTLLVLSTIVLITILVMFIILKVYIH